MLYLKKKGFTLIEIIVTMLILLIVLGIIYPFLSINLKNLNETEARSDLQREGQQVMKHITEKAMESVKIQEISDTSMNPKDSGFSCKDDTGIKKIKYVRLLRAEKTAEGEDQYYVFAIDSNSKTLKYGEMDGNVNIELAHNIDYIQLQPLPSGKSFDKCNEIIIEVKFSKHLVDSYLVTSQVKFRNWQEN